VNVTAIRRVGVVLVAAVTVVSMGTVAATGSAAGSAATAPADAVADAPADATAGDLTVRWNRTYENDSRTEIYFGGTERHGDGVATVGGIADRDESGERVGLARGQLVLLGDAGAVERRVVIEGDQNVTLDAVTRAPGGDYYVAGRTAIANPDRPMGVLVARLEPDGTVLWDRQKAATEFFEDGETATVSDVARTGDGVAVGVTVSGDTSRPVGSAVSTFEAPGRLRWERRYDTGEFELLTDVASDGDGNVLATGYRTARLLEADGSLRWTSDLTTGTFDRTRHLGEEAVAVDGGFVLAGRHYDGQRFEATGVRLTDGGDVTAARTYDADAFTGAVASPDGDVVMTGRHNESFRVVEVASTDLSVQTAATLDVSVTVYGLHETFAADDLGYAGARAGSTGGFTAAAFEVDGFGSGRTPDPPDGNGATDPDDDGAYEDVNGDGTASVSDVQALFANLASEQVQSSPERYDFNGDGAATVSDVQALFAELTAG
jgi:hypothetical protein